MLIPPDVTANWDQFVAECCAGSLPFESPDEVQRAISTLRRMWPERLDEIQAQGDGPAGMGPAIALGQDLGRCEFLAGFPAILARLRGGEKAAMAEIEVASAFVTHGLVFELEPPLAGKTLDSVVRIGSDAVYVEVIAPETSEAMIEAYRDLKDVAVAIVQRRAGVHVDVLLAADPQANKQRILAATGSLPADGWIRRLPDVGLAFATPIASGPMTIPPRIKSPETAPTLYNFHARVEQKTCTSATVASPMQDERATRLLTAELHHFSKTECNALIVCVTNVPGGLTWWEPLVRRWFQPQRNTRVGAVVLYDAAVVGSPMHVSRRWRVIENAYALRPIPQAFLDALRGMGDS
jgi:hypothetical protein